MAELELSVRRVDLPDGPRGTMARLRGQGAWALLESALVVPGYAEWSYLAGPACAELYTQGSAATLVRAGAGPQGWPDAFAALQAVAGFPPLHGDRPAGMGLAAGWVGLLSYDLVRDIERLPEFARDETALPRAHWLAVDQVLAYHHPSACWWHATLRGPGDRFPWSRAGREQVWQQTLSLARAPRPPRRGWCAGPRRSLTERAAYEADVQRLRDAIAAGTVMQVNLTRREQAAFEGDPWTLYEDLVTAHPAPFAAYLEGEGWALASASPERFLSMSPQGLLEARPMKGTARRGVTAAEDEAARAGLAASLKDRAENLMITDLMRNDLGRVAQVGSVRVPELFAIERYSSVWQMVSTVHAQRRADCGIGDILRACWPPGSMTGAPKVKATEIIEQLEPVRRGWYSGSAGYLDCGGGMDLSVLIRSAVVAGGQVMVQLGGGVVADSSPAGEWDETVAKGERLLSVIDAGRGSDATSEPASPGVAS
jgi:para-aminobenzoate synthetase component 1